MAAGVSPLQGLVGAVSNWLGSFEGPWSAQAMKRAGFQDMTLDRLIERFVAIALAQDEADQEENNAKYNRLFDQMIELMAEFLSRPIEQRRALMALYEHPNPQVR